MSHMKNIYTQITETLSSVDARLDSVDTRLDQLVHLMQDMVKMEKAIQDLEKKIDQQVGRVMDRVVEMAMVKTGDANAAVMHRAQTRLDRAHGFDKAAWEGQGPAAEPEGEAQWPPPGCDSMEIK